MGLTFQEDEKLMANMLKNPQGNQSREQDKQKLETKQGSGSEKPQNQPRLTTSNPKKPPQKVLQKRGKKGSKDKSCNIQDPGMHRHTHCTLTYTNWQRGETFLELKQRWELTEAAVQDSKGNRRIELNFQHQIVAFIVAFYYLVQLLSLKSFCFEEPI